MRTYRVEFSTRALNELDAIAEHIADEAGVATADRWVQMIRERVRGLRELPYRGGRVDEWGGRRRIVVAPYFIVYRVDEPDSVSVLRILDGRRDLTAIFNTVIREE